MKELLRKRVTELTALIGVSGDEWDVARAIKQALEGKVDALEVRPTGQVLARVRGARPGPRVMVTAHMDEVGFTVRTISREGFLFFDRVGGFTEACLPGRRVLVKAAGGVIPGVIGVRAGHLLTPEQRAKPQTTAQSYVDICVSSRAEAEALGVSTGCAIVPDSPCVPMRDPDYLLTRAADCRALCAVLVETLPRLRREELAGEVCALFNVMEETSTAAAGGAIGYLKPDYGLFLDTVPCGDVPDCDFERELPIALRGGPTIILSQKTPGVMTHAVSHPKLVAALRERAREGGLPWQEFCFNGASYLTDAIVAPAAGEGLATATLACPRRYSHSPTEIIHLDDLVHTQALVERFLYRPVDLTML